MNRSLYLPVVFFLTAFISAKAADRVALVIGNGAYEHASKLPNATNDSTSIAKLLKGAGFELAASDKGGTGGITDVGTEGFYGALERFKKAASGAKVALVYYAGHGMEVDGKNYLLPVDASLESAAQLRTQAVPLDTIMADMQAANVTAKMVILDCCRNDPLTRSWLTTRSGRMGLADMEKNSIPDATMVMFSTAPGKTALDGNGGNSPFTKALLAHLGQPGMSSFDAFLKVSDSVAQETGEAQVPWISFDGAGRALRLLNMSGSPPLHVQLPTSLVASGTSSFLKMTDAEALPFVHLVPDGTAFWRVNLRAGQSLNGLCADIYFPEGAALVYYDECTFHWKQLQETSVKVSSSLQEDMTAVNGIKRAGNATDGWYESRSGRRYKMCKANKSNALFATEGGFTLQSIGANADRESPFMYFCYQYTVHTGANAAAVSASLNGGDAPFRTEKVVLLFFVEK